MQHPAPLFLPSGFPAPSLKNWGQIRLRGQDRGLCCHLVVGVELKDSGHDKGASIDLGRGHLISAARRTNWLGTLTGVG